MFQDKTWIKMPKWSIFVISFLWNHQCFCFHYWDYLRNIWRKNWQFIFDGVEGLDLLQLEKKYLYGFTLENKFQAFLFPYKLCVTEKRTYVKKIEIFVLVLLSTPLNTLPWVVVILPRPQSICVRLLSSFCICLRSDKHVEFGSPFKRLAT